MIRIKQPIQMLGAMSVARSSSSSDIWPGYPGADQLPAIDTIPNPFKFFDVAKDPTGEGYVSSPAEWQQRREEIQDLVQRYWLGYRWPTKPENVTGSTWDAEEPNTISVGFDFPPIASPVQFNLTDAFNQLADKLQAEEVVIRELCPPDGPFAPPVPGEVKAVFGPVSDGEAASTAIAAWNAGYALPYHSFGKTYYAVLKDYTGELTAPPPPTKAVTYHTVKIVNPETNAEARFHISIRKPDIAQTTAAWGDPNVQVPAIIDIGKTLSPSQVARANEEGYAYIQFRPWDIYPDVSGAGGEINRDGVYTKLYPYDKDVYEYASGALMAWGWAVSQIISALEQPAEGRTETWGEQLGIDPARTLVTGHSRFGKSAMFAAAFDERIRIALPSEPGGSGIQSYRYKVEGKIFNFNAYPKADRVYGKTEIPTVSYGSGSSWFPETAAHFVGKDNRLPFDAGDIIALIAPRPFLATTGIDSHWLGNEGAVAAVQAASEVYAYIGRDDEEKANIAIRARQSDHILYNRDLAFALAIMDREFKQKDDRTLHVKDLFPGETGLGNMTYPAREYSNVGEFNSYPYDINSSYIRWSRPDKYTLWTARENFLAGRPVTITAHSNAPDVKLILPDRTEVSAASREGETFIFQLNAEQSMYGRYELRTDGDDRDNRSVFFAAVSLADALRHATSKGDEGEENRLIGFSSRLANTPGNPPEVFAGGRPLTMSFTSERSKPEQTTLLEYGVLFHDKVFAQLAEEGWDANRTFHIRNLEFVPIPGFAFEISFGNIYASAADNGKEGAARFTQPISWNAEKYNNGPAAVWPEIPDHLEERKILESGGAVMRPEAPAPRATGFSAKIARTKVQRSGGKTNIIIDFDARLDTREFGFGLNAAKKWDTSWSADGCQVTLSVDEEQFTGGSNAELIIFRLKDTEGNMLPGPVLLPLACEQE